MRKLGELFYINKEEIYAGVLIGYNNAGIYYLPVYQKPTEKSNIELVKKTKHLFVDPYIIKSMPLGEITVFSALNDKEFLKIGDILVANAYYEPTKEYDLIEDELMNNIIFKDEKYQELIDEKIKRDAHEQAQETAMRYKGMEEEHQKSEANINQLEENINDNMIEFYQQNILPTDQVEDELKQRFYKFAYEKWQEKEIEKEKLIQKLEAKYALDLALCEQKMTEEYKQAENEEVNILLNHYSQLNQDVIEQKEKAYNRIFSLK